LFFSPVDYRDFHCVSPPDATHSRNIAAHPQVALVTFGSTAEVGQGQAVYVTATAKQVPDADVEAVCGRAFRTSYGTGIDRRSRSLPDARGQPRGLRCRAWNRG